MLFLTLLVWTANSQFGNPGLPGMPGMGFQANPNQLVNYCNQKSCYWNCVGNCKGLFVCGPDTETCDFNCPQGRCNDEIAVISLSAGRTTVNCQGEAVCNKMVVSCGDFSPRMIAGLNNVGGTIQNMLERMIASPFPKKKRDYGICKINCGMKSCIDMSAVCMGDFAAGAGCELTASGQLSFENSRYVCGTKSKQSHCQANCGLAMGGSTPNQGFNPNVFGQIGQFGSDFPCHNGRFTSYNANFFCNGMGCAQQDILMYGKITNGYRKFTYVPNQKPKTQVPYIPQAKPTTTTTKRPITIMQAPTPRKPIIPNPPAQPQIPQIPVQPKQPVIPNVPFKPKKAISVYTHSLDRPLKPGFLRGRFTHIDCVQAHCKFLCETAGSCNGLTIIADIPVRELVIECSEGACIGLKVLTNAYLNIVKCKDQGACAAASIRCGKNKNPNARVYGVIKTCDVECTNGGCSFFSNPASGVAKKQGLHVECNPDVLSCRIFADSANSLYPHPGGNVQPFGPFTNQMPNQPGLPSVGSFGEGSLNCNIRKAPIPMMSPNVNVPPVTPFGNFIPNYNMQTIQPVLSLGSNIPQCYVSCSTRKDRKYCSGFKYKCAANKLQCQCEDFCTQHITECMRENIRGDCPNRQMPTMAPTNRSTPKPVVATTQKLTTTNKVTTAATNKATTTRFNENKLMTTTKKATTTKSNLVLLP